MKKLAAFLLIVAGISLSPARAADTVCGTSGICQADLTGTNALILPLPANVAAVYVTISNTFTGTLDFLQSGDGGVSYAAAIATDGSTQTATGPGQWRFVASGLTNFKVVPASSLTGTATVRINWSTGSADVGPLWTAQNLNLEVFYDYESEIDLWTWDRSSIALWGHGSGRASCKIASAGCHSKA